MAKRNIRAMLREAADFVDCNEDASELDLYEVVSSVTGFAVEPGSKHAKACLEAYEDACSVYWAEGECDDGEREMIVDEVYDFYFGPVDKPR